ncbi:molybdate/tungstate transport system substrate-binding protein [Thermodesulfobium acidiphilum]|uniref:Molybdate/tungstate transport system substrate-binding protein n=1 Tax=Thermodesulfobium acidiphilum TaxID=1794699 RepID=A0A2R4W1A6_THEAF|nr:extracellular solute-binding protein [Thermodesulfobium acidiphilum]AWB10591.1 molybdate/tungstate transport system substrate-binding protein [Thermodesulfobium acidiphilum]
MKRGIIGVVILITALIFIAGCGTYNKGVNQQTEKVKLYLYGAGTLAKPFKEVIEEFEKKYPNVTIESQFGGSVKMVKQVTELHQPGDIIAVADYNVIPKYMFGENGQTKYTDWYIGFVNNSITFVYTDKSKYANEINSNNWYKILSEKGVQIGRSNPNTDPSGYQTLQMLKLAEKYYKDPTIYEKVLANAPERNIRDTETELLSSLEAGQIDYLAIYKSDALQHHLKYLDLPPQINLSDPKYANFYKEAVVDTKNGELSGKPIIYAITIPNNSKNTEWAIKFVEFLLSPEGQSIMKKNGFGVLEKPYANNIDKVPPELKNFVSEWPK